MLGEWHYIQYFSNHNQKNYQRALTNYQKALGMYPADSVRHAQLIKFLQLHRPPTGDG
jgi:hypothetical protein